VILAFGLLLGGLTSAMTACRECQDPGPLGPSYVLEMNDALPSGIASGRVEVTEEAMVIDYETTDGSAWRVAYDRVVVE
jgi:hypothetical protein